MTSALGSCSSFQSSKCQQMGYVSVRPRTPALAVNGSENVPVSYPAPASRPCQTGQTSLQIARKPTPGLEPGTPSLRVMNGCPLQSALVTSGRLQRVLAWTGGDWRGQPGGRLVDVSDVAVGENGARGLS